jgi:hypothetical protein
LNFEFKVEHFFVLVEEVAVESHEIVEEILLQPLGTHLMLELGIDLPHDFQAHPKIQTKLLSFNFLEMIWIDLFARIIEIMKFSFSQRTFSYSFSSRNRYDDTGPNATS